MSHKSVLFVLLCLVSCTGLFAQLNNNCPGCVANTAQFGANVSDFAVGLFPDTFIIRQNSAVSMDVTYLLPKQVNTGIAIAPTATVSQVQILGINASNPLPSGLSITCDQSANNCIYSPQTYRFGCVKICGTTPDPATNGFVKALITVAGTGSAAGQTQTQNQDIAVYYKILPDTTACHTVCFQNKINTGCDSATIGIYAGIDISCPNSILNPCVFSWDFGNGHTGTGMNSQTASYTAPGNYAVTLTKNTQKLQISSASFSVPNDPAVLGAFPCSSGCAWYNNICNGFGVNNSANKFSLNFTVGAAAYSTSDAGSGNLTGSFTNLNYDVVNQAVAISVHDACLLTNINTGIATLTINGPGVYNWAVGSDATGSITVVEVPKDTVSYTDSVHIYASPAAPVIAVSKDSLCYGDSARLSIDGRYAGLSINWYKDSTYMIGFTDTALYVNTAASYSVKVIDPVSHCFSVSQPRAIAVSGVLAATENIQYVSAQHSLFLNPFIPGSTAVWYYDSVLVTGQSGQILPSLGDGHYQAVVFPAGYAQCSVTSGLYTLNTHVGILEAQDDVYNLSVYPNPNNGTFAIKVNVMSPGDVTIRLTDMLGRDVYVNTLPNQNGEIRDNMALSELAKNVYTLQVSTSKGKTTKRVVIE